MHLIKVTSQVWESCGGAACHTVFAWTSAWVASRLHVPVPCNSLRRRKAYKALHSTFVLERSPKQLWSRSGRLMTITQTPSLLFSKIAMFKYLHQKMLLYPNRIIRLFYDAYLPLFARGRDEPLRPGWHARCVLAHKYIGFSVEAPEALRALHFFFIM